jgi:hypothetical protein
MSTSVLHTLCPEHADRSVRFRILPETLEAVAVVSVTDLEVRAPLHLIRREAILTKQFTRVEKP